MLSTLALFGAFAACGVMLWGSTKIEPHWVSKDGARFTCRVQRLGQHDAPVGSWREMRAIVDHGDLRLSARGMRGRDMYGDYRVVAKSEYPPKGKVVYICDGPSRVVLRLPANSRAVPVLDDLADLV